MRIIVCLCFLVGCNTLPENRPANPARTDGLDFPFEVPPDTVLIEQISEAIEFREREDFDRFLDAKDPGELIEHATLTQLELDRAGLGLDALFVFGDELFEYEFRPENGLGNALGKRPDLHAGSGKRPNPRRVHEGEFGGPDSHSCATCHFKGGPDGAGNNTQNAFLRSDGNSTLLADVRNPPHLLGLGPVEALAREMSADLKKQKDTALADAKRSGMTVERTLVSKGVQFGFVKADADGSVDTTAIDGVDADLVVKPFGWKGHQPTIRAMAEESFRIHLGVVSMHDQARVRDGQADKADYGDGVWYDVDRDGSTIEVDEGMLTTTVVYLAQLEAPVIRPPEPQSLLEDFARGEALFGEIGCASCHRPFLELQNATLEVRSRDPKAETEVIPVNVARDGEHPKVEPLYARNTPYNVRLFSDLKRHDLGAELATPTVQAGILESVFLTRPLWGLALTAPYLHDGRAPTVHDAIRLHGGEAMTARDQYLQLPADERAALQIFLLSLTRKPKLFVP